MMLQLLLGVLLVLGLGAGALGATQVGEPAPATAEAQTDRFGLESVDGFARAEVAFWQTLHGVVLGAEACMLLECETTQMTVGALLLGGATGLGTSLLATQEGLTPGRAHLLNSATGWGFWDALALNFILETQDQKWGAGLMMVGQLAGLGAGIALWEPFRPNAGDVALINSSGIWSGVLTGFVVGALELELDSRDLFGLLLAATNGGGAAGAWLAGVYPMGAGRVFVINASGIVGALAGFGTALFVAGDEVANPLLFGSGIAGTLAGLGLGTYFTQDWVLAPPAADAAAAAPGWAHDLVALSWAF